MGYNGFGRLTGDETGSVGGGMNGGTRHVGRDRLGAVFDAEIGGQIAWLLPAALILLWPGSGVTLARAADRPDPRGRCPLGRLAARHRGWSSAS